MKERISTMNAQKISNNTNEMIPLIYENAQVIFKAYNQEVLHETALKMVAATKSSVRTHTAKKSFDFRNC